MRIELTQSQIDEVFEKVLSEKSFEDIADNFDISDMLEFLKKEGIRAVKTKFNQAINSYALEAFQDALSRGVDPWKIQESLNNLK